MEVSGGHSALVEHLTVTLAMLVSSLKVQFMETDINF